MHLYVGWFASGLIFYLCKLVVCLVAVVDLDLSCLWLRDWILLIWDFLG